MWADAHDQVGRLEVTGQDGPVLKLGKVQAGHHLVQIVPELLASVAGRDHKSPPAAPRAVATDVKTQSVHVVDDEADKIFIFISTILSNSHSWVLDSLPPDVFPDTIVKVFYEDDDGVDLEPMLVNQV